LIYLLMAPPPCPIAKVKTKAKKRRSRFPVGEDTTEEEAGSARSTVEGQEIGEHAG
jgi:hypothetical protein